MIVHQERRWAVAQLRTKAKELGRLPKKADFVMEDIQRIKAALGPWPRALEKAGLKPPKENRKMMSEKDAVLTEEKKGV